MKRELLMFLFIVAVFCMAFFGPHSRECRDVRPWSVGGAGLGASGTYCADFLK